MNKYVYLGQMFFVELSTKILYKSENCTLEFQEIITDKWFEQIIYLIKDGIYTIIDRSDIPSY